MKKFITENPNQTKSLGKLLAEEVSGGEIICLSGDLGAGKTTFTQGFLEGIGAEGPFTSPTFNILKEYTLPTTHYKLRAVCHIDAYRISEEDLENIGWKDFAGNKKTVTIVEWAEKIREIIPREALWIHFKWIDENKRTVTISHPTT